VRQKRRAFLQHSCSHSDSIGVNARNVAAQLQAQQLVAETQSPTAWSCSGCIVKENTASVSGQKGIPTLLNMRPDD
jgi:hypothetical protein